MLKNLLSFFDFLIIRKSRFDEILFESKEQIQEDTWNKLDYIFDELEELRRTTWDQDKISLIEDYLLENFFFNDKIRKLTKIQ